MRGKAIGVPLFMNSTRITPAYAGKSQFGVGSIDRIRGSPPPMRGKGQRRSASGFLQGITPAYAGKRLCFFSILLNPMDHPRLCGEKRFFAVSSLDC